MGNTESSQINSPTPFNSWSAMGLLLVANQLVFISIVLFQLGNYQKLSVSFVPWIKRPFFQAFFSSAINEFLGKIEATVGVLLLIIPFMIVITSLLEQNKQKYLRILATMTAAGGNIISIALGTFRGMVLKVVGLYVEL